MPQSEGIKATMADVVAGRKTELLPGRRFVNECLEHGKDARVEYDVTITDSLTSSRRKPRYPARNMLKVVNLSSDPRKYYWHESPGETPVAGADLRPEAANTFGMSPVPELLTTTAWVQVPDGLWEDPETFESFINYRLIVRLATAENVTILKGEAGLLEYPGIARLPQGDSPGSAILAACNEVEQVGCTADGLIINPADYYQLLGSSRLMQNVEDNGVFIVRTRLVDPGTAIVGDFGHGAQLFDAGRSVITFADAPEGTFAEPGLGLKAEIYERVVVNLPATFYVVSV